MASNGKDECASCGGAFDTTRHLLEAGHPGTARADAGSRVQPGFFGGSGEREWRYGLGIDHEISPTLYFGAEFLKRDIVIPIPTFFDPTNVVEEFDAEEHSARTYFYWTPGTSLAFGIDYRYDDRENEGFARTLAGIDELHTHRVPLSVRYFHPSGFSAEATATYVDQEGEFFQLLPEPPFEQVVSDGDRFWVLDAAVRYRLPRRMGIVSVTASNVLDEEFRFQDIDPLNPDIIPERLVSLKLTVAF